MRIFKEGESREKARRMLFRVLGLYEKLYPGFRYAMGKGSTLEISYHGYKHMHLAEIEADLVKCWGLSYDFSQGEGFDKLSGRTYVYFKDVYND